METLCFSLDLLHSEQFGFYGLITLFVAQTLRNCTLIIYKWNDMIMLQIGAFVREISVRSSLPYHAIYWYA